MRNHNNNLFNSFYNTNTKFKTISVEYKETKKDKKWFLNCFEKIGINKAKDFTGRILN